MFLRASRILSLLRLRAGLLRTLAAALVAASACSAALAQSGVDDTGTGGRHIIQGRVLFPSGRRADVRLKVRLESSQSGELSVYTDTNGSFSFRSLQAGSYTVIIEGGDDFETFRESVYIEPDVSSMVRGVTAPPVSRPYTLQVYLQPKNRNASGEAAPGILNASLADVPKPAVELYNKALEAERKNENDKAVALLGQALTQYPQFGLAHSELGLIYFKERQLDRAVEELKAAARALPDDPQVATDYGLVLLDKQDYAEAEKQFRRAAKKNSNSPQLHVYLGVSLMRQRGADDAERVMKIAEAEKEFQESLKLGGDPTGRAHYYLGGIYWSRHEYKKAASELETFLKISPNAPDAEQVRGTITELRSKK